MRKTFFFYNGEKKGYDQTCGQPQGLVGSFDAFAYAHHILWLMTMKLAGMERDTASSVYRVLGDDNVGTSKRYDPENVVFETYKRVCQWAGWEVDEDKTTIIGCDDRNALGEFAKVTVLNGVIVSPPPIRIMSRVSSERNYYAFSTALWMLEHGFKMPNLLETLVDEWFGYDDTIKKIALEMIFGGMIPLFEKHYRAHYVSDVDQGRLAICYLVTKIRGTFMECLMRDEDREALKFSRFGLLDSLEAILGKGKVDLYISRIENTNHKLLEILKKNIFLETSLRVIIGEDRSELAASLLDVPTSDLQKMYYISELLISIRDGHFSDEDALMAKELKGVMKTLDRYQMRSYHKHAAREVQYIEESIYLFKELFPEVEPPVSDDLLA